MGKFKKHIVCAACGREIVDLKYRKKTCGRPECTKAYRKIYRQIYYRKNKEKILKRVYLWRKLHPDLRAAQQKRYRERKKNVQTNNQSKSNISE